MYGSKSTWLLVSSLSHLSKFLLSSRSFKMQHVTAVFGLIFLYFLIFFLFFWFQDGGGVAEERGWRGHSAKKKEGEGVVCPRRQMARGAGPWWAGAGQAPCAVVGNWGPGWNVGGTLILSATVFLRHRSPLPPPICSFHRSYGRRSCAHMQAHENIHRRACTYPCVHTHTSETAPLLIGSFGFSYSASSALPPTSLIPIL